MTLGQSIGKVVDNFTITNDAGDKVQIRLAYDFSTATGVDIKTWEADYRFILDASRKANPDLRLVFLDPFEQRTGIVERDANARISGEEAFYLVLVVCWYSSHP